MLLGYNIEPLRKEVPLPREAPAVLTSEQETTLGLAAGLSASKLWVISPSRAVLLAMYRCKRRRSKLSMRSCQCHCIAVRAAV